MILGSSSVVVIDALDEAPVSGVVAVVNIQIGAAAYLPGEEGEALALFHVEWWCHQSSFVAGIALLHAAAVVGQTCAERPRRDGPAFACIEGRRNGAAFKVGEPHGGVDDGSAEVEVVVIELIHLEDGHALLGAGCGVVEDDAYGVALVGIHSHSCLPVEEEALGQGDACDVESLGATVADDELPFYALLGHPEVDVGAVGKRCEGAGGGVAQGEHWLVGNRLHTGCKAVGTRDILAQ